jgi:hypothetical protein
MKSIFFIAAFVSLLTVTCTISCNKDQPPKPEQVDSVNSILPKQIIIDYPSQYGALEDKVVSFKYDTANYKIELYSDDTTNTNPYDELLATYTFNKDGYLIKCTGIDLSEFWDDAEVTINRAADNKVISVVYHYTGGGDDEITTFKYEPLGGGIKITTVYHWDQDEADTAIYEYNDEGRILNIPLFQGTQNLYFSPISTGMNEEFVYTYNADKSLKEVSRKMDEDVIIKMKMDYSSGIPANNKDWLSELLLGKDYYLLNLSTLNPFSFFVVGEVDPYMISATNPDHVSHIEETIIFNSNATNATMAYQFNDKNLLSSVILTAVNSQYGTFVTGMYFKY